MTRFKFFRDAEGLKIWREAACVGCVCFRLRNVAEHAELALYHAAHDTDIDRHFRAIFSLVRLRMPERNAVANAEEVFLVDVPRAHECFAERRGGRRRSVHTEHAALYDL